MAALLPALPVQAAEDPDLVRAGAGLASLAAAFDDLAELEAIDDEIPLTGVGFAQLLGLDAEVFRATLGGIPGGTLETPDDLETAIEGASLTAGGDGLTVTYDQVTVDDEGDEIDIAFDVEIERIVDLPVLYSDDDAVLLADGDFGQATATLAGSLSLTLDTTDDTLVLQPGTLTVDLDLDDDSTFDGVYGITDVDATSTGLADLRLDLDLVDPDGEDGISRVEWETTLPVDLVSPAFSGGGLDLAVTLDSPLVTGSNDGDITVDVAHTALDADPGDNGTVYPDPVTAIGPGLSDLATVNTDDLLVGLGQLAAVLTGAQAQGDVRLPLVDATLADVFDPGAELLQYVERQGSAVVVCGAAPTDPPSGRLTAGDTAYCQAITDDDATNVDWHTDSGTIVANDKNDDTVGPDPSASVELSGAGADPAASVTFEDPAGEARTAERRARSVQEVAADLSDLGLTLGFSYDPSTSVLDLTLTGTEATTTLDTTFAPGDELVPGARLADLTPSVDDDATVEGSNAAIDVDFGALLGADDPDNENDPLRTSRRFFVRDTTSHEVVLDAFALTDHPGVLQGRIGSLPVDVTAHLSGDGTIDVFGGNENDATDNALEIDLDLDAEGSVAVPDPSDATDDLITGAVLLDVLVNDLDDEVLASTDIQAAGTLDVSDGAGLGLSGEITLDGYGPDGLVLSYDQGYAEDLRVYDIRPTVTGVADAAGSGDATTTLVDAGAGFTSAFGLSPTVPFTVDATLLNLTDGASCTGFQVVSDTELACEDSLEGPADDAGNPVVYRWDEDDVYEITGDPDALTPLVADSVYEALDGLATAAAADQLFTSDLPLVDLTPHDLVADTLTTALDRLTEPIDPTPDDDGEVDQTSPLDQFAGDDPPMIDDLEDELASALGDDAIVTIGHSDLDHPEDLSGNTTTAASHLTVLVEFQTDGEVDVPLRVDLGDDLPTLREPDGATGIAVAHDSVVSVDLAVPLHPEIHPSATQLLGGTGAIVDVDAHVAADDLPEDANAGPLPVEILEQRTLTGTHDVPTLTGTDTRDDEDDEPSTTTLVDDDADFVEDGVETGQTAAKLDSAGEVLATCTIDEVTTTEVTCDGDLTDGASWDAGDDYRIDLSSTTTLVDDDADFVEDGVETGQTAAKLDGDGEVLATCTIDEVTATTVTCDAPLGGGQRWDRDANYRIDLEQAGFELDVLAVLQGTGRDLTQDHLATIAGSLAVDPDDGGTPCGSDTIGCATLPLRDAGSGDDLGVVEVDVGVDDDGEPDPSVTVSTALEDALAASVLDLGQLDEALGFLPSLLRDGLNGRLSGQRAPLIGGELDAGADVPGAVTGLISDLDVGSAVATAVADNEDLEDPDPVDEVIEQAVTDTVTGADVDAAFSDIHAEHVTVEIDCHGSCSEPSDVQSVEVGLEVTVADLQDVTTDFATGLPGLDLVSNGSDEVSSDVGWTLDVGFGLDRTDGPYLAARDDQDDTGPLLDLDVDVAGIAGGGCGESLPGGGDLTGNLPFSADRCLADGRVGLLDAALFDGTGDQASELDATVTVTTDADQTLDVLVDRPDSHSDIDGTGAIELLFDAEVAAPGGVSLPRMVGVVTVGFDTTNDPAFDDPAYEEVAIDVGGFASNFLAPITSEITHYTEPFIPVVDTITAPIPVVSDLSKATGGGPISLLTVLQAVSGNDLGLIQRLATLLQFIDDLANVSEQGFIPLSGSGGPGQHSIGVTRTTTFTVPVSDVQQGPCGSERGQQSCKKRGTSVGGGSAGVSVSANHTTVTETAGGRTITRDVGATAGASGAGLSFPFLDDSSQLAGMLVGNDATLVRFSAGTLKAGASLSYGFGPFMAGPVPVEVTIGGTVRLQGRFAMGFDTRGLRRAADGAPVADAVLAGIFIDDLDSDGNDVPEVRLTTIITVGASVSVKIVKAGVEGGVQIDFDLNLNDTDGDGKLRFEDIRSLGAIDPLCIFDRSASLSFFLAVFVEIDLVVETIKERFELWRLDPPINLFEVSCDPPEPVLAQEDGGDLRLNVGSQARRDDRAYLASVTDEFYLVRQTGPDEVTISFEGKTRTYQVPSGGKIVGDAGSGSDVIQFLPGSDDQGNEVPFTFDVDVSGGSGEDTIYAGDGDDLLDGGAGDDDLRGGDGDDVVFGGPGDDGLEGGRGDDLLHGGGDDDVLTGAAGGDALYGGDGDDRLSAGPALRQDIGDPADQDGVNVLVGGADADVLTGGAAGDWLFGDEPPTAADPPSSTSDFVSADHAPGNVVSALQGLSTSTLDTICTEDGAGSGGPDELDGGPADDMLVGGDGSDVIEAKDGDDLACGNGGDDDVDGGDGEDDVHGGSGHDRLHGAAGDDDVDGGDGDDLLLGADGEDLLVGGTGADAIDGADGADTVHGDAQSATGGSGSGIADSCEQRVRVLDDGTLDLDGDGSAEAGRFAGYAVTTGGKLDVNGDGNIDGDDALVLGEVVVEEGLVTTDVATVDGSVIVASGEGDCLFGGDGDDTVGGGPGGDRVFGEDGEDELHGDAGDDHLRAGRGDDEASGGGGDDTIFGDSGEDLLQGDAGEDTIRGGLDGDTIVGGDDDDTLYGDAGDDLIEGDDGADTIEGNAGEDVIIGGTTAAGLADDGDTISGGSGDDLIAGDNATTGVGELTLQDEDRGDGTDLSVTFGADTIHGDGGADTIYGQGGDDDLFGGDGDDHVEGNSGADTIEGNAGDDDLIGGTSASGRADGGDTIDGDDGVDRIAGDNAAVADDSVDGLEVFGFVILSGSRTGASITLFDEDLGDDDTDVSAFNGADTISGGDGADLVKGGGADDTIEGNASDDYVEGNGGADEIDGNAGEDVLIGGSSLDGRTDAGDTIHGDGGDDHVAGDNAAWQNGFTLLDLAIADGDDVAALNGGDTISGGEDEDDIHGQGGNDTIDGDAADDHLEGGDGDDLLDGGPGDDDLIGGSSADEAGIPDRDQASYPSALLDGDDTIVGGAGEDLAFGDNATIDRDEGYEAANGPIPALRFSAFAEDESGPDGTSGDDALLGDGDRDQLYGQRGGDLLDGGADEDVLVGDPGRAAAAVRDERVEFALPGGMLETSFAADTARWTVELFRFTGNDVAAGDDVLVGRAGDDSLHSGPGADLLHGGADVDEIYAGSGADVTWGGAGHDRLWGGSGEDHLDVGLEVLTDIGAAQVRDAVEARLSDHGLDAEGDGDPIPVSAGDEGTGDDDHEVFGGLDLIYGGLDQDVMLADEGDAGPVPGDRLIDAVGNHNAYLRCQNAYGEGVVTRRLSPRLRDFLQQVAEEGGAFEATGSGSSGLDEVALVLPSDARNNNRPHPSVPSSGICPAE